MIPVDLYAHQSAMNDECRDLMLAGKKWVLMQGATGIGKSRMAAAQIQKAYEKRTTLTMGEFLLWAAAELS